MNWRPWEWRRKKRLPKATEPSMAEWLAAGEAPSTWPARGTYELSWDHDTEGERLMFGRFVGRPMPAIDMEISDTEYEALKSFDIGTAIDVQVENPTINAEIVQVLWGATPIEAQLFLHKNGLTALDSATPIPDCGGDSCWQETEVVLGWSPPMRGPQERAFLMTELQLHREALPARGSDGKFLAGGNHV